MSPAFLHFHKNNFVKGANVERKARKEEHYMIGILGFLNVSMKSRRFGLFHGEKKLHDFQEC